MISPCAPRPPKRKNVWLRHCADAHVHEIHQIWKTFYSMPQVKKKKKKISQRCKHSGCPCTWSPQWEEEPRREPSANTNQRQNPAPRLISPESLRNPASRCPDTVIKVVRRRLWAEGRIRLPQTELTICSNHKAKGLLGVQPVADRPVNMTRSVGADCSPERPVLGSPRCSSRAGSVPTSWDAAVLYLGAAGRWRPRPRWAAAAHRLHSKTFNQVQ